MTLEEKALKLHSENPGKISIEPSVRIDSKEDLNLVYTPGVAEPCRKISEDPEKSYEYTSRGNIVAVVSDGSAVLGLGNIGPEAAMPVMEGKANLFKKFGEIDGMPIVLDEQGSEELITAVKAMSPTFGAINLEDIESPKCFEVERRLKEELDIPVFHDDQHGTAIVVRAALLNALDLNGMSLDQATITVIGAGAAGIAVSNLLLESGAGEILPVDSDGVISPESDNRFKSDLAERAGVSGEESLQDALSRSDVVIGLSVGGILSQEDVEMMNGDPIVFALANPDPEIMPEEAYEAGASIVATGRSDFDNQVNNSLVFPGIFRGALDAGVSEINEEMMIAASEAVRNFKQPEKDSIVPETLDKQLAESIAGSVRQAAGE